MHENVKKVTFTFQKKGHQVKDMYKIIVVWCRNTTLNTSFRCFKCRGLTSWPPDDLTELFSELLLLTLLLMTELAALLGPARLTVPWLELELGVGLWGPWEAFLSSLLAVSEEVEPELTPDELWMTRFLQCLNFLHFSFIKRAWTICSCFSWKWSKTFLKVSKFQKQLFFKLHCPKNERNIRKKSSLWI